MQQIINFEQKNSTIQQESWNNWPNTNSKPVNFTQKETRMLYGDKKKTLAGTFLKSVSKVLSPILQNFSTSRKFEVEA